MKCLYKLSRFYNTLPKIQIIVKDLTINKSDLIMYINEILFKYKPGDNIYLMLKLFSDSDNYILSLGTHKIINIDTDLNKLADHIIYDIHVHDSKYSTIMNANKIIFEHRNFLSKFHYINSFEIKDKISGKYTVDLGEILLTNEYYPLSYNILDYGNPVKVVDGHNVYHYRDVYIYSKNDHSFIVKNKYHVELLKYKDVPHKDGFFRIMKDIKLFINNNQVIYKSKVFNHKPINKSKKSSSLIANYITYDIETYLDQDKKHIVYCVA